MYAPYVMFVSNKIKEKGMLYVYCVVLLVTRTHCQLTLKPTLLINLMSAMMQQHTTTAMVQGLFRN